RGIRRKEMRELLAEYGVDDQATETMTLIATPRSAARLRWRIWSDILPEADPDLMVLEAAASQIQTYQAQRVPELLQAESYTIRFRHLGRAEHGSIAAKCLAERQQLILDERRTPVTAIIAETVLRQPAGDTKPIRSQLAALTAAEDQHPQLRIRVLPS